MTAGRYQYQSVAIEDAAAFLRSAKPGERRLYASPTGTGKSYVELAVQRRVAGSWIVTPREEIGFDMLRKQHIDPSAPAMHVARICTPIVLRNRLLAGEWEAPAALIIDEAHHHSAETYQTLDLLCGLAPAVGFTATPYRGTPRQTAAFRRAWGEPAWIVTYPEAIDLGVLSMPACRVVPLVDDDVVTITNGQFEIESVEDATRSRLDDAAHLLAPYFNGRVWDRPTMVSLPSRALANAFATACILAGLPGGAVAVVTGETPRYDRQRIFAETVARRVALVQIQVVSEGVDLPIRRMLDLHPMLSPVEWLQSFGRITRPVAAGEPPPEYVCCNRNLMRHAYLLEGCLPPEIVAAGDKLFGGPSKRLAARALGLETLGRFAGVEVPLADGTTGVCYNVSACEGATTRQYVCVVHPLRAEPFWATRVNQRTDDPMKPHYGRWQRCGPPDDLSGFASIPPSPLSDKQKAWWKRDARRRGLDPDAKVTRKNFGVLPVLTDTRASL